ncbi:hypothetical protein EG329_008323 [Mollisiaceae sp. DMI_Dod_QoI]|nr:hypothetical protein EG329_008323 [Helotiales sp. DMI_Dod_QoI]
MSLFHLAAHHNHVELVKLGLEKGVVRYSCVEPYGTAFTAACHASAIGVMMVFLDDCNDTECSDLVNRRVGITGSALHYAAKGGRDRGVRLLLLLGAAVDARNDEGYTPLAMAVEGGHAEIVRVLCEEGADPRTITVHGLTSIDLAILAPKKSDVLRALVDSTAVAVDVLDAPNGTAYWPVHTAAAANKVHALGLLLQAGCSLHQSTPAGLTPAHYAAHGGAVDALLWLCNQGVVCCVPSADGSTPLHLAAERGHVQAVEWLLSQQGTDINAVSSSGHSALHLAALNGHLAVIEALLKAQPPADPKLATPHGETPLLLARSRGHQETEARLRGLGGAEPSDRGLSAVSISAECHLDGRGKEYVTPMWRMPKLEIKHDTVYEL